MVLPTLWVVPVAHESVGATLSIVTTLGCAASLVPTEDVRDALSEGRPDCAVIHGGDLSMEMVEVQRWLSEEHIPVLILVDALTEQRESLLLGRGAKDVVGLPASETRLRSRVGSFVRDHAFHTASDPVLEESVSVRLDPLTRSVQAAGVPVAVTKSELDLLLALAERPGEVVTRGRLAHALGKPKAGDRALESHFSRLRLKFRAVGSSRVIESVRGQGYRLIGTTEIV